jgi:hypothetical protein
MKGRTAHTILISLLLVSACIPVEFNVNIVPEEDQTPDSTSTIPSPTFSDKINPTITPFVPALTPPDITPPPGGSGDQNRAVEAARRHMAGVLDVPVDQITLLQVEPVTWPDTSLGCLQPGRVYAQVLTPGYRILLEYAGQRYELHSDQSGNSVISCDLPATSDRIPLSGMISKVEIVERARQHLADRIDLPLETVLLVGSEPSEWNDLSLGCGKPSPEFQKRSLSNPIPGFRILLSAVEETYEYHSGGEWLVFCGIAKSGLNNKILLPPTVTLIP